MTPERWQVIKDLFEQTLAISSAERDSYLTAACRGDVELRREIDSLIASHENAASGFLDASWTAHASRLDGVIGGSIAPGTRVGPYLLRERLGRGGMGEVFAAVRADGQYEQRVALKLVRSGLSTPEVLDRFRGERQILAGLDHPNIARLLDGGTTEDGVPYFVMELVDGVPIDVFCRDRRLTVRERLTLFLQVCAAVQYAHQRLVIHRDLKPGNILVTRDGVPKLLDFGIAKMLDPLGHVRETTLRPLTLEYASPEQVRGEPVSTASDVYALAVVLFQLLTGRLPYGPGSDTSAALAQAIMSRDPARPSTTVALDVGPQTTRTRVRRELRGDLDVILLKALRKEPDKRYASVEQFADDIRRHVAGLPVTARTGTWSYTAAKFVRRHRAGVAAAALVLATLVAGIVVTVREARIAQANRRRADARFNDVRKLANSLIFEVHDSIQNVPGTMDARRLILQRSLEYLDSLAKESGNEPDLMRELASGYDRIGSLQSSGFKMELGDTKAAAASLQKSLDLREALARANPLESRDQIELAAAYESYGEYQAGALGNATLGFDYEQRALAILDREALKAPDDARLMQITRGCLTTLGMMQVGNGLSSVVGTPAQGIADLERARTVLSRQVARSPDDAALREREGGLESIIAQGLMFEGDRQAAIVHLERAIAILEPIADSGSNAAAVYNLAADIERIGDALLIDGRPEDALRRYVASERRTSTLTAADPRDESARQQEVVILVLMGRALTEVGRMDEGVRTIRRALAMVETSPDAPDTRAREALGRGWLGEALERQGKRREALQQYIVTKERLGALLAQGIDNPRVQGFYAIACDRLGSVRVTLGDIDSGVREYDEAAARLEPLVKAYPPAQELAYALADTYTRLGMAATIRAEHAPTAAARQSEWRSARDAFKRSLDVWQGIAHPARMSGVGFEVTVPAEVSRRLAQSEGALKDAGHQRGKAP